MGIAFILISLMKITFYLIMESVINTLIKFFKPIEKKEKKRGYNSFTNVPSIRWCHVYIFSFDLIDLNYHSII